MNAKEIGIAFAKKYAGRKYKFMDEILTICAYSILDGAVMGGRDEGKLFTSDGWLVSVIPNARHGYWVSPDPQFIVDEITSDTTNSPCSRCQECGYITSLGYNRALSLCINGKPHLFKDFPQGESAADLARAEELIKRPLATGAKVSIALVDACECGGAKLDYMRGSLHSHWCSWAKEK